VRRAPVTRPKSMRVGFLRALDEYDTRALLNTVEDDFRSVRRNVEIANHKARRQIGQLTLAAVVRIQLPEILAPYPGAKKYQRS